jgi:hypothetical protein
MVIKLTYGVRFMAEDIHRAEYLYCSYAPDCRAYQHWAKTSKLEKDSTNQNVITRNKGGAEYRCITLHLVPHCAVPECDRLLIINALERISQKGLFDGIKRAVKGGRH